MARAVIALGSNLGDRLRQLRIGVDGLAQLGTVVGVSSLYETAPVGGPEQGPYLNAAAVVETNLPPEDLLVALHRIEGDSDRTREVRWGPRTLDLDIVAYDDLHLDTEALTIPHPRAHERRFVLEPTIDVAPQVLLADGSTPAAALERVAGQALVRWPGDWRTEDPGLGREAVWWVTAQFALLAVWAVVAVATSRPVWWPATLVGAVLLSVGLGSGVAAVVAFRGKVTASPQPRPGTNLVDHGVYRLVRHPMYGALILSTAGGALVAGSWQAGVVTVLLGLVLRLKSAREESVLGIVVAGYSEYRTQVARRFVPFVW